MVSLNGERSKADVAKSTRLTLSGHPDDLCPTDGGALERLVESLDRRPIPRVYNFVNVSIWLSGCEFGDAIEVTLRLADLAKVLIILDRTHCGDESRGGDRRSRRRAFKSRVEIFR
jgi:hypothetical protein